MTLDYKKMFLIVTEEAVVKGHFTGMHQRQLVTGALYIFGSAYPGSFLLIQQELFYCRRTNIDSFLPPWYNVSIVSDS